MYFLQALLQHYADVTGVDNSPKKIFFILAVVLISPIPSILFIADSSHHLIKFHANSLNRPVLMKQPGYRFSINHWVAPEHHPSL